jgi:hypothetical protein
MATPMPGLSGGTGAGNLLIVLMGLGVLGAGGFWWGRNGGTSLVGAVRLLLLAWIGGLIGYNYFALGLPGAEAVAETFGSWGAVALAWTGALVALGVSVFLNQRATVGRPLPTGGQNPSTTGSKLGSKLKS